jgi:hypothetical protein
MVKECPNCAYQNPDTASICAVCGHPLASSINAGNLDVEIDGISSLRIGMLIVIISGLVGIGVAIINGTYASSLGLFSVLGSDSSVPISASSGSSNLVIYGFPIFVDFLTSSITLVLFVVSMYFVYHGFSELETVNRRLSTGKTGSMLLLIGVALIIVGLFVFIGYLLSIGVSGTVHVIFSSVLSILLAFSAFVLIGAIILIIGLIMLIIGLYRVGSIYNTGLVTAGSIVFLFINYIGAILLYVGFGKIKNKLEKTKSDQGLPTKP